MRTRTRTSPYGPYGLVSLLLLLLGAGLVPATSAAAADNGTWGSSPRLRPVRR